MKFFQISGEFPEASAGLAGAHRTCPEAGAAASSQLWRGRAAARKFPWGFGNFRGGGIFFFSISVRGLKGARRTCPEAGPQPPRSSGRAAAPSGNFRGGSEISVGGKIFFFPTEISQDVERREQAPPRLGTRTLGHVHARRARPKSGNYGQNSLDRTRPIGPTAMLFLSQACNRCNTPPSR